MKRRVLFVCVHNSARSQMAEAYLRKLGGDGFEAESAGFEPTVVNPLVVEAMREEGIDISDAQPTSVFELVRQSRHFSSVITVCDRAREKECPTFPGMSEKLHWNLRNPEDFAGSEDEIMEQIRALRDEIKTLVQGFIDSHA